MNATELYIPEHGRTFTVDNTVYRPSCYYLAQRIGCEEVFLMYVCNNQMGRCNMIQKLDPGLYNIFPYPTAK